jgi:hypothetical protein
LINAYKSLRQGIILFEKAFGDYSLSAWEVKNVQLRQAEAELK